MEDAGYFQNILPFGQLPYFDCHIPGKKKFDEEDLSRLYLPFILPKKSINACVTKSPFPIIYVPQLDHYQFSPPLPEDLMRHSLIAFHDVCNIKALYESILCAEEDEAQALAENYDYISPLFLNEGHKYIFNKIAGVDYDRIYRLKGSAGAYKYYYRKNIPLNISTLNDDPLWRKGEFKFGPEYYINYFTHIHANKPEQELHFNSKEFESKENPLLRPYLFSRKFDSIKSSRYKGGLLEKKNIHMRKVFKKLKLLDYKGDVNNYLLIPPFINIRSFDYFNLIPNNEYVQKSSEILNNYVEKQKTWDFYNEDYNKLYGFLFIKDNDSFLKIYTKYIPNKIRLHLRDPLSSLFPVPINSKPKNLFYFFRNADISLPYYCQKGFFDISIMHFYILKVDLNEYEMKIMSLNKSNCSYFSDIFNNNSKLNINTHRFWKRRYYV